jgi:chromosome segregation ATPase
LEQDFINELDQKVTNLIESYTNLKKDREKLSEELNSNKSKIQELEGENGSLKTEKEALNAKTQEQQEKIDTAGRKVKDLIAKLEAIEQ